MAKRAADTTLESPKAAKIPRVETKETKAESKQDVPEFKTEYEANCYSYRVADGHRDELLELYELHAERVKLYRELRKVARGSKEAKALWVKLDPLNTAYDKDKAEMEARHAEETKVAERVVKLAARTEKLDRAGKEMKEYGRIVVIPDDDEDIKVAEFATKYGAKVTRGRVVFQTERRDDNDEPDTHYITPDDENCIEGLIKHVVSDKRPDYLIQGYEMHLRFVISDKQHGEYSLNLCEKYQKQLAAQANGIETEMENEFEEEDAPQTFIAEPWLACSLVWLPDADRDEELCKAL